jgi:hypothetical protein
MRIPDPVFFHPRSRISDPTTWHEFPNENVKFIRNKQTFNEELKKHFLSKLDANYRCVRLLCPHCHPPDGL